MNTEEQTQPQPTQPQPEQTITKTPPPNVKNPKRVEQGRKLAAISRAAKLKKKEKAEKEKEEEKPEEESTTALISSTTTILGTCCTLLLTFIAYSQWSKENSSPPKLKKEDPKPLKKSPVVYKDLSQYDL